MEVAILVVHVLLALALIGLILLQQGKGADAGASFGSGASQTVFGAAGSATFLTRTTKWLAIFFFSTSLGLAYLARVASEAQNGALVSEGPAPAAVTGDVPAAPASSPARESAFDVPAADVPAVPAANLAPTDKQTGK